MSFLAGLGGGIGLGTIIGTQSVTNALNYSVNDIFPNTVIQITDLIDMTHRGFISKDLYYSIARLLGFNDSYARLLYAGSDALITPEQAVLYRIDQQLRLQNLKDIEQLTPAEFNREKQENINLYLDLMKRSGYRQDEAQRSFLANRPIPTFSTILEWLAKEVFEPEAIKEFQLDAEQPEQLAQYMDAYGVPADEARKYWISHWNTIGFGQWRELYNRFNSRRSVQHINNQVREFGLTAQDVTISDEAYKRYFTVLEQTPYFRNRLLGATSNPIPFTTLQDLYRYGILNDSEVKEFLRDYNYSDYNAQLIVDAWGRKYPFGERNPKQQNILYQFKIGNIPYTTAFNQLRNEGLPDDIIIYQLDVIFDDILESRVNRQFKYLAQIFGRKKISEDELKAEIAKLTPSFNRRAFALEEIKIEAEKYITRLSVRQIGNAYKDGKFTEARVREILDSYRMREDDITVFLEVYAQDETPVES